MLAVPELSEFTNSRALGLTVPIPTSPKSLIIRALAPEASLAVYRAYSTSGETSLALFENAVSTVSEVLLAMAVTVRVSPVTKILSPTTSSVRNKVPTPGTVADAAGSIDPVSIAVALPVVRKLPAKSSRASGDAVPIPTAPLFKILIASVPPLFPV